MSTIHISAEQRDIASVVIMPGDPLRAKWIADNFLSDVKEVNSVRGMLAYTGIKNGKTLTVMGHGMGMGSMGIYSYELFGHYDVDLIIRVGSCGALKQSIPLNSVALAIEIYSDGNYGKLLGHQKSRYMLDSSLKEVVSTVAKDMQLGLIQENVYTVDSFYTKESPEEIANRVNCSLIEMEAFALSTNAKHHNKESITLLTVSDNLVTNERLGAEDREKNLRNMIHLSFEVVEKYMQNRINKSH